MEERAQDEEGGSRVEKGDPEWRRSPGWRRGTTMEERIQGEGRSPGWRKEPRVEEGTQGGGGASQDGGGGPKMEEGAQGGGGRRNGWVQVSPALPAVSQTSQWQ